MVRNSVEAAGVAVVLDGFEVLEGFRDFGAGDFFRIFQHAGAVDHRGEFGDHGRVVLEKEVADRSEVLPGLKEQQDREGEFSFLEVGAERFAGLLLVARDIEDVVVDLVGDAEFRAVGFERADHGGAGLADERAEFAGGREKRGRLHLDDAVVIGGRELQVEAALGLDDLARADLGGGVGDAAADVGVAEIRGELERVGEEDIAQKDADRVAPFGVRGGLVAAEFRAVDNVVMDKRGDVDEFQDHREIDMGGRDFSGGSGGEEGQGGAKAFASGAANVGDVALDGGIEGLGLGANAFLHGVEVGVDQIESLRKRDSLVFRGLIADGLGWHGWEI